MSGHSKWATIKRKKAANDAKRGQLFAKLVRAVEVAARQGGADPEANATLASAIAKAKSNGVPNDNIERALQRAAGQAGGEGFEEIWYEGYGPGGVALYVQVLTDNRNRAASDVRSTFTRNGGNLGEPGSVSYLFTQTGQVLCLGDEDTVLSAALEAGAEDVRSTGSSHEVLCPPADLQGVVEALTAAGVTIESAEVTQLPTTTVPVDGATAPKLLRLVDALEDLDDVQAVYANFDIEESVLASLAE